MSDTADDDANPWSCVTPTHIPGKGEALVAAGNLPPNRRILRVAPFAAVPYGRFLDTLCSGCLQPCDASRRCSRCDVARHCALCASSLAGRAHAYECHALARLKRNERGLTLHHDDLRLLLRVLSRRRLSFDDAELGASSEEGVQSREEESFATERDPENDPFITAAAEDSDVVVDSIDALDSLMSGFDGDDDGELDDNAVETLKEVAKQCKFLVAAACRTSEETYARLLGKLQLNGFEITSAEEAVEADAAGDGKGDDDEEKNQKNNTNARLGFGKHAPSGVGVFPSCSRLNHSCEPNCAQRFDAFACVVVETTRAIKKGEELTIPYVDVSLDCATRNARLQKAFAFRCDCARCVLERGS
jgi:SET and MYND domain-containing protein